MQNKGIVMQIKDGQAILMTPEGQFLKVPFQAGMEIGQEVAVTEVVQPSVKRAETAWYRGKWQQTGMIAASLVLAVGLWSSSNLFAPTAYAYVTVDINPSVELGIDNSGEVVTATALNSDGEQVLEELKLRGIAVEEAVEAITEASRKQGFLQDNAEVVITAAPAVEADKLQEEGLNLENIEDQVVDQVSASAQKHDLHVSVEGVQVSKELHDAAREAGLSPGKYALYLTAQANGIDVTVEELKTQPISKIVEKRGTELADVLHDLKGKEQLDDLLDTLKKEGEVGLKQKGKDTAPGQQKKQEPANGTANDKQGQEQTPAGKESDSKDQPNGKDSNGKGNNNNNKNDKQPPGQEKKDNNGKSNNKKDQPTTSPVTDVLKDTIPPLIPNSNDSTHTDPNDKNNGNNKGNSNNNGNGKGNQKEDDKKGKGRD